MVVKRSNIPGTANGLLVPETTQTAANDGSRN